MKESNLASKARAGKASKPEKPKDFPLTAHPNGQWSKKIRGRVHYFGPWANKQAALDEWLRVKDDLLAGRTPRPKGGFTVMDLCNSFLTAKKALLAEGEITEKTFYEWHRLTDRIISFFHKTRLVSDLRPTDFQAFRVKLASDVAPSTLRKMISLVESVFRFAFENEHIDVPVRFGSEFRGPSRRTLRLEQKKKPKRFFTAAEIRKMLTATDGQLRAMILLGINCGFGQSDCARLPKDTIDLKNGWIDYHREKTGVDRRSPLWPETVQALEVILACRPTPKAKEDAGIVFITKYGQRWVRDRMSNKTDGKYVAVDSVAQEMRKLVKELNFASGRNFYALRHTFQTIGDEAKDPTAVMALMGHTDDSMSGVYREGISDERLKAVTDHVHRWLFPRPTVEVAS